MSHHLTDDVGAGREEALPGGGSVERAGTRSTPPAGTPLLKFKLSLASRQTRVTTRRGFFYALQPGVPAAKTSPTRTHDGVQHFFQFAQNQLIFRPTSSPTDYSSRYALQVCS